MKKPLLITLFLTLGIGGFLLYQHLANPKKVSAWDLVPQESVLVYEKGDCQTCIDDIKNAPVAGLIKKAALVDTPSDSLHVFRDLASAFDEATLVSLHLTRKDQFDFTYYIEASPTFLNKLQATRDAVMKVKDTKSTQREFNNTTINEIRIRNNVFSWTVIDNIWVGSFSPVLIEDVIRTYQGINDTFRNALGKVYHLHSVRNDGGNLFINLSHLGDWFSIFLKGGDAAVIENFGRAALLDTKIAGDQIVLNGFSANTDSKMFLAAFSDQSPVPFSLRHIIPNRTLMVTSYGFTNGGAFFSRLHEGRKRAGSDSVEHIIREINFEKGNPLKDFSGEVAVCITEGRSEQIVPLLIINDREHADTWMEFLGKAAESKTTDTLFIDHYSNYKIYQLPNYRLPQKLFAPLVSGFDNSYYVKVGQTICITEDIEELKRFLNDIDQENTWGKSVAQNKFFETTLLEANVSVFVNTPRVWSMLENSLQPKWKKFLQENQSVINSLGMGAIQFSHLNDNFYTNVSWSLTQMSAPESISPRDRFMTVFDAGIVRMKMVDSHVNRSKEAIVQDSARNLMLMSPEGKVHWKIPLDENVAGEIHQIDFFANGKLQYFFCTPGKMHLVDRLGNYVAPFPVEITEKEIDHISLVDYDHSKKYRYMIASTKGDLWIYDKTGANLEGWQPRRVEGRLLTAPRHHRLLGKDYMLAVRADGVVYLMNRRGEMMPNFPLKLDVRLAGDYFINRGRNTSETTITVVSNDGWRINFNLQGKVVSREVLVKTSLDARFSLCAEKEGKSYLITRQENAHFTIFDDKLNELIKSDYIGNDKAKVEFHLMGNGNNFIVITDQNQELTYIYDKTGKLLTSIPLESSEVELYPEENGRIRVFSVVDNNFRTSYLP